MGTMLVKDWDWDMAMKVAGKENFEMGMEKGVEKGISIGRKEGMGLGRKEGMGLGVKKGMEKVVNLIEQGVSLDAIKKMVSKEKTLKKRRA